MDKNPNRGDEDLEAPDKLVEALARLPKARVSVPRRVDEAILREAREHLRPVEQGQEAKRPAWPWAEMIRVIGDFLQPNGPRWRPVALWSAMAASFVLVAWLTYNFAHPASFHATAQTVEDLNHDGKVDILDAFCLARQLERGERPSRQLDLNGDGVVDERDVAIIAAHAVSLERTGRL
jgi:hypothetical protein